MTPQRALIEAAEAILADKERDLSLYASLKKAIASAKAAEEEIETRWIEIKEGCEMPPYGVPVWVVWNGNVQHVAYSRDIGEWVPCGGDSDPAPDGTFSHYRYIDGPKEK